MSIKNLFCRKKKVIRDAWIARDRNGSLWLYIDKPNKNKFHWISSEGAININSELSQVKWGDDALECKLTIEI